MSAGGSEDPETLIANEGKSFIGSYVLGGENMTLQQMLATLADVSGLKAPRVRLSARAVLPVGIAGAALLVNVVLNLLLIPLWLLSGAFFPATGAPRALRWLMRIDPLTYGMAALRRCLYLGDAAPAAGLPGLGLSLAVLGGFALAMLAGTTALARRTTA